MPLPLFVARFLLSSKFCFFVFFLNFFFYFFFIPFPLHALTFAKSHHAGNQPTRAASKLALSIDIMRQHAESRRNCGTADK